MAKKRSHGLSVWLGAPGDRMMASLNRNMRAVIPLFSQEGREMLVLRGCGVLFTLRREYFLLSAAHVFDEMEGKTNWTTGVFNLEHPLWVNGQVARSVVRNTPTTGNTLLRCNPRDDDPLDIGVMRIETAVPPALASEALTLADIDLMANERGDKMLAIVGWPARWIWMKRCVRWKHN